MRVFLDANILFSAAKSNGAVRALLRLLAQRGHECCVDDYVVAEARRNLERKGPAALNAIDALSSTLLIAPVRPAIKTRADSRDLAWLPEKDRPILASAIALQCDVLLTGDRTRFGSRHGYEVGGALILSPRLLAEQILAG